VSRHIAARGLWALLAILAGCPKPHPPPPPPPGGPPVITISGVAPGDVRQGPVSPAIAVSGTEPLTVEATLDGAPFASGTAVGAEGDHLLSVNARDGAGRTATAQLAFALDRTPPVITVSGVSAGQVLAPPATPSFSAADPHLAQVSGTLDGVPIQSGTPVTLVGPRTLVVTATDRAGNAATQTVSFSLDDGSAPPELVLDAPLAGALLPGPVPVSGRVQGGTEPLTVRVDGADVPVVGRAFATTLALPDGDHTLAVAVSDRGGRTASASRSIAVDSTAPTLDITRPASSPAQVTESPYRLQGTVGDPHLATVTVQGNPVTVVGGAFAASVPLTVGNNDVTIAAEDVLGHATVRTVRLTVTRLAPSVTILEPIDGSSVRSPVVHVRARVAAGSALASVYVGTGPATAGPSGTWEADVPLSLGQNTIAVTATDVEGLQGTATATVRYSDPRDEPLRVTGVDPAAGATGVEPSGLVSVSFNKAVDPSSLAAGFSVRGPLGPLAGGFYVAPGGQTVSFVAKAPLAEGVRHTVSVQGLLAASGPAQDQAFGSDFTTRARLRRLHGVVLDDRTLPVSGALVEVEGTDRSSRSEGDGHFTLLEVREGPAVVRLSGTRADGRQLHTIRRSVYVAASGDTELGIVPLAAIDPQASQQIDGSRPGRIAFAGSQPGLAIDLPEGGMFLEGGRTTGLLTATQVPTWARPVPVDGQTTVAALWQLMPIGTRTTRPVGLSLPNVTSSPAGTLAVLVALDPDRNVLARVGLARLTADGTAFATQTPISPASLDLFGYQPLDPATQTAVEQALAGAPAGAPGLAPLAPVAPGPKAAPPSPAAAPKPTTGWRLPTLDGDGLRRLLLSVAGGEAYAQSPNVTWLPILDIPTSGFAFIEGSVVTKHVATTDITLDATLEVLLGLPELQVTTPYELPLGVTAQTQDPTTKWSSLIVLDLRIVRGGLPVDAGGPPVQGAHTVHLSRQVPLPFGETELILSSLEGGTRRVVRLVATLSPTPLSGTVPPGTPPHTAWLRLKKVEPVEEVIDVLTGKSVMQGFFAGISVMASARPLAATDDVGHFFGFVALGGFSGTSSQELVCAEFGRGSRQRLTLAPDPANPSQWKPHMASLPTSQYVCKATPISIGGTSPVSIATNLRLLTGEVRFVQPDGTQVPGACNPDATTAFDPASHRLSAISPGDVATTEVFFFREENLQDPIAAYTVVAPVAFRDAFGNLIYQDCQPPGPVPEPKAPPHATYTRFRADPKDTYSQAMETYCRWAELNGATGAPAYRQGCQAFRFATSLAPGDRLVVVGVNHATGYAGMSTITVPPVVQAQLDANGNCPADLLDGRLKFTQGGRRLSMSRCSASDFEVRANLLLYPPEIEMGVTRRAQDEGLPAGAPRVHFVRHGGAATTRDDWLRLVTQWRVRLPPCEAAATGGDCPAQPAPPAPPVPPPTPPRTTPGPPVDWANPVASSPAKPGEPLELLCSELPETASADDLARCRETERRLRDMPPGVPPLWGQLVRVTNSAVEVPSVALFHVAPGKATVNLQPGLQYTDPSGKVQTLASLVRANYYVNVVGSQLLLVDLDKNGLIDPQEAVIPPPALAQFDPAGPAGRPLKALALKDVYQSWEPDGSLVSRFDRALEHEFRVVQVTPQQVLAFNDATPRRLDPPAGTPAASEFDGAYQLLLQLIEPNDPGRAGTLPGTYGVRLGSDLFGIDCKVKLTSNQLTADCDDQYLPEVLAARDIVYFDLFLSGNAENVLYRFNIQGLSPRSDLVTASHVYTHEVSLKEDGGTAQHPVPEVDRPVSSPALAVFFIGKPDLAPPASSPAFSPGATVSGSVKVCVSAAQGSNLSPADVCKFPKDLLKEAALTSKPDGSFEVVELGGRDRQPLQQTLDKGVRDSRRFALPLPPDVARMLAPDPAHGLAGDPAMTVYLVVTPGGGQPRDPVALGMPRGRYQGAHARAPGQEDVAGVNLADGHVSLRHEDLVVPEYGSTVRFSRTYDNGDNEVGPLGIGWRHSYEAFVHEEYLGRYAMVLEGQSYDFPRCDTVDSATGAFSSCRTDNAHGGELSATVTNGQLPVIEFRAPNGHRYRFEQRSRKSTVNGRRRWLLSAFDDGHGVPDALDPKKPGRGWTLVTYKPDSDLVDTVARSGGKLKLSFGYTAIDPAGTHPKPFVNAARAENLQLLTSLTLERPPGTTLASLAFSFQGGRDNLQKVDLTSSDPTLPGTRSWVYAYDPLDPALSGADRWMQSNELNAASLVFDGGGPAATRYQLLERTRWLRLQTWLGIEHVKPYEVVSEVAIPGTSDLARNGTLTERRLRILYSQPKERIVIRPDDVHVTVALNDYGNVVSKAVGGIATPVTWFSQNRGGQVAPQSSTAPTGRSLSYAADAKLRETTVSLTAAPPTSRPVAGVAPGTPLVTRDPDPVWGRPTHTAWPSGSGAAEGLALDVDPANGEARSVTLEDSTFGTATGLAKWWADTRDADGQLTLGRDPAGQTHARSNPDAFGLYKDELVTYPGTTPDGRQQVKVTTTRDFLGRVISRSDDAGHAESWTYDLPGRLTGHTVSGTPDESWAWTFGGGPLATFGQDGKVALTDLPLVTVVEALAGTAHQRTLVHRDGLLWTETYLQGGTVGPNGGAPDYGQPQPTTRTSSYLAGKLDREWEADTERHYLYDAVRGWLLSVTASWGGSSPNPVFNALEQDLHRDDEGKVVLRTDANGLTTQIEHDALGREVRWDYGGGDVEVVRRDARGNVLERTFGQAPYHTISYVHDARGSVRSAISTGTAVRTHAEYDALGRRTYAKDDEAGTVESWEYHDVLGRPTLYTRIIESRGGATFLLRERRSYADTATAHTVTIDATIEVPGQPGRQTTRVLTLDARGRLLREESPATADLPPSRRTITYDERGSVTQVEVLLEEAVPGGAGERVAKTTSTFDAAGRLVETSDPEGNATSFRRDALGNVVRQEGPLAGEVWTFVYDGISRLESKTLDFPGRPAATWEFRWKVTPNVTQREIDPENYTTDRAFNARGKLLREERKDDGGPTPSGNGTLLTQTWDGPWPKQTTVLEGSWTRTLDRSYDDRGRPLLVDEAWNGAAGSYHYQTSTPWSGRTAAGGETWTSGGASASNPFILEVDSLGKLVARDQGGLLDVWMYDAAGQPAFAQPAGKPATRYEVQRDAVVSETAGGEITRYTRDSAGRVLTRTDPSLRTETSTWYLRDLVESRRYGTAAFAVGTDYAYDERGNATSVTRGAGTGDAQTWGYAYGPRGELLTVDPPGGLGTFTYGRDRLARLTSIAPPSGGAGAPAPVPQTFQSDYLGRSLRRTRGAGATWSTSWSSGVGTTLDPNGDVAVEALDGRGRVVSRHFQPGAASAPYTDLTGVEVGLDPSGQLLAARELRASGSVASTFSYDHRGRLLATARGSGPGVGYGYGASDELASTTTPSGATTYTYDGLGRLQTAQSPRGSATFSWEPGGARLLSIADADLTECRDYDDAGRLRAVRNLPPGTACGATGVAPLAEYRYTLDGRGNRTELAYTDGATAGQVLAYGYDEADRLLSQDTGGPAGSILYGLAPDGTRYCEKSFAGGQPGGAATCATATGATSHRQYQYDTRGGLSRIVDGAGAPLLTVTTDPAGRVTSQADGQGNSASHGWDASGRLIQVSLVRGGGAPAVTRYTYDHAGRQVGPDPAHPTWIWGPRGVEEEPGGLRHERGGGVTFAIGPDRILHDGLGSAVGRAGQAGTTVRRFDAWGVPVGPAWSSNGPAAGFAGQFLDAATGLSYAEQRWYDAAVGRFLSPDPVGAESFLARPMGLQAWLYAGANPTTNVDPDGRCFFFTDDTIGCLVKAFQEARQEGWAWSPKPDQDLHPLQLDAAPVNRFTEQVPHANTAGSQSARNQQLVINAQTHQTARTTAAQQARITGHSYYLQNYDNQDFVDRVWYEFSKDTGIHDIGAGVTNEDEDLQKMSPAERIRRTLNGSIQLVNKALEVQGTLGDVATAARLVTGGPAVRRAFEMAESRAARQEAAKEARDTARRASRGPLNGLDLVDAKMQDALKYKKHLDDVQDAVDEYLDPAKQAMDLMTAPPSEEPVGKVVRRKEELKPYQAPAGGD